MVKIFNLKPILNKNNKQINISLPKRKLPKKFLDDLNSDKIKDMKLNIESWRLKDF